MAATLVPVDPEHRHIPQVGVRLVGLGLRRRNPGAHSVPGDGKDKYQIPPVMPSGDSVPHIGWTGA